MNEPSREKYGITAGIVGVGVNLAIFAIEFFVGMYSNSIAITADAFHNLTDGFSSVITAIGFFIARKPPDKEHPFGHGKSEYLSALFVSMFILFVGIEFVRTSVEKILHPSPVVFSVWSLILVLAIIPMKLALGAYYKKIGKKIDSPVLSASKTDALNDVFILAVASISLVASAFVRIGIDGYLGAIVAIFIIHSGYSIAAKAADSLLGEAASPALTNSIREEIEGSAHVRGIHDLLIHNYGVGKYIASVHVDFPEDLSLREVSGIVEKCEEDIRRKHSVEIAIHIDTVKSE